MCCKPNKHYSIIEHLTVICAKYDLPPADDTVCLKCTLTYLVIVSGTEIILVSVQTKLINICSDMCKTSNFYTFLKSGILSSRNDCCALRFLKICHTAFSKSAVINKVLVAQYSFNEQLCNSSISSKAYCNLVTVTNEIINSTNVMFLVYNRSILCWTVNRVMCFIAFSKQAVINKLIVIQFGKEVYCNCFIALKASHMVITVTNAVISFVNELFHICDIMIMYLTVFIMYVKADAVIYLIIQMPLNWEFNAGFCHHLFSNQEFRKVFTTNIVS